MHTFRRCRYFSLVVLLVFCSLPVGSVAESMDRYRIGGHGQGSVVYPSWFKQSFLDLRDDLADAREAQKRGIIVMFSQKNCSHCQAFIDTTLSDPAVVKRLRASYDVIALDIFSDNELTYLNGTVTSVKDFAEASRARLTPTFIFFGVENRPLLKIIGLYPPEKFGQVLDYIDSGDYAHTKLGDYLRSRKTVSAAISSGVEYDFSFFSRPPHDLSGPPADPQSATLVFFDRPACPPCKRFHNRVLADDSVRGMAGKFRTIQLDAEDVKSQVITPDGQTLSPRQWAQALDLNYDFSVVFFDRTGKEVHRIDSETGKDRMSGSMQYVLETAYQRHEQFLQWRKEQALKKQNKQ